MNVKCKRGWLLLIIGFFLSGSSVFGQEIKKVKIGDLEKIISETKAPVIVNFWATWCKPCLEELPYFLEEYKNYKKEGLQLLMVNMDFKEEYLVKVKQFISKNNITAPVYWLDETNADIFCPKIDSSWGGAIPATLFINRKTGYRNFYEAQISHATLKKEIMAILREDE